MSNERFAANLRKLADHLGQVRDDDYDHGNYGPACGTALCALGHAAASRLFAPLRITPNGPAYDTAFGAEAAQHVFGPDAHSECFSTMAEAYGGERPTKAAVIAQIRAHADTLSPPKAVVPAGYWDRMAERLAAETDVSANRRSEAGVAVVNTR